MLNNNSMALRSNSSIFLVLSKCPACIDKCMLSMELITPWNKRVIFLQSFQKKTNQKKQSFTTNFFFNSPWPWSTWGFCGIERSEPNIMLTLGCAIWSLFLFSLSGVVIAAWPLARQKVITYGLSPLPCFYRVTIVAWPRTQWYSRDR